MGKDIQTIKEQRERERLWIGSSTDDSTLVLLDCAAAV